MREEIRIDIRQLSDNSENSEVKKFRQLSNVKCLEIGTTKEMAARFGPKPKTKMAAVEECMTRNVSVDLQVKREIKMSETSETNK